ncbi:hypothetical protein TNCV_3599991 [Trichonephila clavipes]|nr:hypothetical protein TNCV_3599991 [Trichonephila clavipes]
MPQESILDGTFSERPQRSTPGSYSSFQLQQMSEAHCMQWVYAVVHPLISLGDWLTNTFTKDFCVRITNTFKKVFLCLDSEHIFGGDQGDTPEIIDEILTIATDLELEVNEEDIEELIMRHEDELTIEELLKI